MRRVERGGREIKKKKNHVWNYEAVGDLDEKRPGCAAAAPGYGLSCAAWCGPRAWHGVKAYLKKSFSYLFAGALNKPTALAPSRAQQRWWQGCNHP